ncbi:thiamine phosphate synthase [Thalassobellus suaedae]|uniref:Thiamine phosphate synthase n=1 Tax=Thalassobellus suaedae TaxID=3074124 RepID=A0ABY9Y7J7_9FLAO|nr:thiamine phosphate synthase [Flavobacteriaceae bacterium HL-DH10]
MVVLIAPEYDIKNEMVILHELFREGLPYYHFRKPHYNYEEYCEYLNQIDSQYHNRVVVHQFHELFQHYNLKGIHFQEAKRREVSVETLENIRNKYKISMSSSFHSPEELGDCKFNFDYHLLSPVFSSISKQGYKGQGFDVNHINKTIIGMGGVTTKNLNEFDKLGYQGIGVLGGIWQSPSPINDFKKMRNHFLFKS